MFDHIIELNNPVPNAAQNAMLPPAKAATASRTIKTIENTPNDSAGCPRPTINAIKFNPISNKNGETWSIFMNSNDKAPSSNQIAVTK